MPSPNYPRPLTESALKGFIGERRICETCGRPFRAMAYSPRLDCLPCSSIVKHLGHEPFPPTNAPGS
jgi:hypothetical protein